MRVEAQRRGSRAGGIPPWAPALGTLVLGIVLGLVYGWMISPVEVQGGGPEIMGPGSQQAWVEMVADSYAVTGDAAAAQARMRPLQESGEAGSFLSAALQEAQRTGNLAKEQRLQQLSQLLAVEPTTPGEAGGETAVPPEQAGTNWLALLGGCLLVGLVVVGVGAMAYRMRMSQGTARPRAKSRQRTPSSRQSATVGAPPPASRRSGSSEQAALQAPPATPSTEDGDEDALDKLFDDTADVVSEASEVRELDFGEEEAAPVQYSPALDEFMTRYSYGDDNYDMSFAIETPQTEFLGECGVGVSETLNAGSPQQVTAFEIWLFDKDDIRTVTKVLLSDHAWNDEELRGKLAPKGELIHVQEGDTLDLETKSLRVRARVREVEYGPGEAGQENAFFEHLVVELTPQQKL